MMHPFFPKRGLRFCTAVALYLMLSCETVDLTAPEDASLSISANPTSIGLKGEQSTITVIVSNGDGTPVPDETVVFFTTTLGAIASSAKTVSGVVTVTLTSGDQPGVATVDARSGVAATAVSVDVTIGSPVESIAISANPATLPSEGGASTITVVVFGQNSEKLANIPVVFSTDAGSLQSQGSIIRTDENGEARDRLTTTQSAKVTATSGTISASITVTVGSS